MTPEQLILAGIGVLIFGVAVAVVIDRWLTRRQLLSRLDWNRPDPRQIDIIKRGEVCPWPKDF